MKIKIDYPINGTDLSLFIDGEIIGKTREDHDLFLYGIIAKLGNKEVFRYDGGDEYGLLRETEISEEIRQIAETLLVEEKFSHEQV